MSLVLFYVVFFKLLLLLFVISQLYHLWWIKIFIA